MQDKEILKIIGELKTAIIIIFIFVYVMIFANTFIIGKLAEKVGIFHTIQTEEIENPM
jgi:hypothetical protein